MTLSTRVEQAGGPSRGLDAEIELAIGNWSIHHFDAWTHFQECGEAVNPPMCQPVDPAHYTTSLDAAMALARHLARHDGEAFVMLSDAMIALEDVGWPKGEWAKTMPRYVCAAALRARGL